MLVDVFARGIEEIHDHFHEVLDSHIPQVVTLKSLSRLETEEVGYILLLLSDQFRIMVEHDVVDCGLSIRVLESHLDVQALEILNVDAWLNLWVFNDLLHIRKDWSDWHLVVLDLARDH